MQTPQDAPARLTTRRAALALGASAVTSAAWPMARAEDLAITGHRPRALRLAHLTDAHVQPERGAPDGLAACLRHVQSLKDPPQLILFGGDAVMDVFAARADRAKVQADVWRRVWKAECSLPVETCIGNHDVWGWGKLQSETTGDEPNWGKKWAMDLLGLAHPYRSFDKAGWHFVVLDSVFPNLDGKDEKYLARLDDAQFDWLTNDLANTPATTPVLILSHIPILSAAAFLDGDNVKHGDWHVPGAWMHTDVRRIGSLFLKHPNVKLCLSGHLHLADRCEYNGVTYACNGAVCGNWWKGSYHETPPGYAVVDLYADGSFDVKYVAFGWTPQK